MYPILVYLPRLRRALRLRALRLLRLRVLRFVRLLRVRPPALLLLRAWLLACPPLPT